MTNDHPKTIKARDMNNMSEKDQNELLAMIEKFEKQGKHTVVEVKG